MSALVEFLRARLDEDQRVAQAGIPGQWHAHTASGYHGDVTWISDSADADGFNEPDNVRHPVTYYDPVPVGMVNPDDAAHIARHDPARVLAEVAAKRRILELHGEWIHECPGDREHAIAFDPYVGCTTLRLLALPYVEHADYRDEWKS